MQMLTTWKMRDSCHKAHLHLSLEAEVFLKVGRGEQNKEVKGGGCKVPYVQTSTVHSNKVQGASFWLTSSQLHIILTPWLKVSKSPGAGMLKGQDLYFLQLVLRILVQTLLIYKPRISQSCHL